MGSAVPDVSVAGPDEIRVLTYNVFMRPEPVSYGDKTACRAQRIGRWLARGDVDIVALTETFRREDVETLTAKAGSRFPHQVVSKPTGSGSVEPAPGWPLATRSSAVPARPMKSS